MTTTTRPSFIKAAVVRALPPNDAARIAWTNARFPTVADVRVLQGLTSSLGLDPTLLLSDTSPQTLLERSGGNWEAVMTTLGASSGHSLSALASAFSQHVSPSASSASTRAKDWAGWRAVLTWATARGSLAQLLPMPRPTLDALLWDMLASHCTSSVVKGVIDSVQARHRRFGLPSPLVGPRAYARLIQSLSRFQGTQDAFKRPISAALVKQMLLAHCPSVAIERNCLASATATITCLRPSEGANLQSCDVFYGFDSRHGPEYRGSAALNIKERKQDQGRKGHHPRIGPSSRRDLDLVQRLRDFTARLGTTPGPHCTKASRPHARCPTCAPLFPLFNPDGSCRATAPSASSFSDMILKGLAHVGADTRDYSGICARRGGISTATEARVPEAILWLQSGHAQSRSARVYIKLDDPTLLFQTWAAFQL